MVDLRRMFLFIYMGYFCGALQEVASPHSGRVAVWVDSRLLRLGFVGFGDRIVWVSGILLSHSADFAKLQPGNWVASA